MNDHHFNIFKNETAIAVTNAVVNSYAIVRKTVLHEMILISMENNFIGVKN
jgi:hypothetical protein